MAGDIFLLVNQLSVLLAGRRPQWVRQTEAITGSGTAEGGSTPKPNGQNDGKSLQNSPSTLIAIDLRETPAVRTCRVTLSAVDLTGTYVTYINDSTTTFVAAAVDENALLIAWRDAINASVPTNTFVVASVEDVAGLGAFDTLVIKGLTATDYGLGVESTVGTGVLVGSYDSSSAKARFFATHKSFSSASDPVSLWHHPLDAVYDINTDNFIERFDTAGLDRGYVELTEVRGNPLDGAGASASFSYAARVTLGPAVQETAE